MFTRNASYTCEKNIQDTSPDRETLLDSSQLGPEKNVQYPCGVTWKGSSRRGRVWLTEIGITALVMMLDISTECVYNASRRPQLLTMETVDMKLAEQLYYP